MDAAMARLQAFRRSAWLPVTVDGDGPVTASKFSGQAWLAAGETWPRCGHCGRPMQLFLQLELESLPEQLVGRHGSGLLQLFYCTNVDAMCDVECEAWRPLAESKLVRLVHPPADGLSTPAASPVPHPFPSKLIVAWDEVDDYPGWEEGTDLGVGLTAAEWDQLEAETPRPGDKLAGWPYWVQSVEYPDCPQCGRRMELVFQIDSEDHLPYVFGDVGTGHITQCPVHKEQLAFAWACC